MEVGVEVVDAEAVVVQVRRSPVPCLLGRRSTGDGVRARSGLSAEEARGATEVDDDRARDINGDGILRRA